MPFMKNENDTRWFNQRKYTATTQLLSLCLYWCAPGEDSIEMSNGTSEQRQMICMSPVSSHLFKMAWGLPAKMEAWVDTLCLLTQAKEGKQQI